MHAANGLGRRDRSRTTRVMAVTYLCASQSGYSSRRSRSPGKH